ncbi:hypothetical protein EV715DRAFT_277864 [Schizophyllum commune]
MATPEDQSLPKPIDAEDGQLEILTVPRPLAVIPHSLEEIREKVIGSIWTKLGDGRMSLYPAAALPLCVLSSLASSGAAGLSVRAVTQSVATYGFFPGSWAEAYIFRATMPLDELLVVNSRLSTDPIIHSRFYHWLCGVLFGVALGLSKKVHVDPLPRGAFGKLSECSTRLRFVLETAFYLGGSLGVYYFYAKRFAFADARAALSEKMQSIVQHSSWYRDYALTQTSPALKIATTSSLVAIPTALGSALELGYTVNNYNSLPFVKLYARRAGFWGSLGLLAMMPIMRDLLVEGITPSNAVQEYRAALQSDISRAWDKHILCGALLGGSAVPFLIRRAPTIHIMHDFVRAGRFMRSPRNVFVLGSASIMLGGSLGSLAFIARHLLKPSSNGGGDSPRP